jgi:hypothetical protein
MRDFPSEKQFYEGNSLGTFFASGCILSPLRIPFRHIGEKLIPKSLYKTEPSLAQILAQETGIALPYSIYRERRPANAADKDSASRWLFLEAGISYATAR